MKDKFTPRNVTSLKQYVFSENHPDNDFSDVPENSEPLKMTVEFPILLFPYELEQLSLGHAKDWEAVSSRLNSRKINSINPTDERLEEVKKGRFETSFANTLSQHINLPIHTEVNLQEYSPDIAINIEKLGLWIDIEIDEPYITTPDPTPIHFKGYDKERDLFFLEKKWIVLRFHEKQVAELSQCCLKYVYLLLKSIGAYQDAQLESLLDEVPLHPLFWYKKWTKDESWRMILNKSRGQYRSDIDYIKDIPEQRNLKAEFVEKMKRKNLEFGEYNYLTLSNLFEIGIYEVSPPFVKFLLLYKPRRIIVTKILYDNYLFNIKSIEFKQDYTKLSTNRENFIVAKTEEFASIIPLIENGLRAEAEIEHDWNRLSEKAYWNFRSKEIND